jgi:hypothetical protein
MGFTNWQLFGIAVLVVVFFYILFTAVILLIKYMKDYKD